jgi:hypothetical protein
MLRRAAWKIARAVLFGWLYWLQRPPGARRYWQSLGVIFLLMAAGLGTAQLMLFPSRIAPIANPAVTKTHEIDCDKKLTGGTYIIEVNGVRHECTGADSWCPYGLDTPLIVYNSKNPARCRVAHNAKRLSRWEVASVLDTFAFLVHGLALLLVRENDPNELRKVMGHGALLIALGLHLFFWKFDLNSVLSGMPG